MEILNINSNRLRILQLLNRCLIRFMNRSSDANTLADVYIFFLCLFGLLLLTRSLYLILRRTHSFRWLLWYGRCWDHIKRPLIPLTFPRRHGLQANYWCHRCCFLDLGAVGLVIVLVMPISIRHFSFRVLRVVVGSGISFGAIGLDADFGGVSIGVVATEFGGRSGVKGGNIVSFVARMWSTF